MRRTSSTVIMSSDVSRAVRQWRGCARVTYASVAKQSDDETDRAFNWSPGRTHWWTTTTVAIVGAIVGGTSLIMNFFYQPSPPPTTIESGHSEFMKLS